MEPDARNKLAVQFGDIASEVGRFIVTGYPQIHIGTKADGSPVSDADTGAERLIRTQLSFVLRDVPIVGEETFDATQVKSLPGQFVLLDPIDGTRDFIAGGDYYTVNIALIDEGVPIVGCVYAPALSRMYIAGASAFRTDMKPGELVSTDRLRPLKTRPQREAGLRAVVSRSHLDAESDAMLKRLPVAVRLPVGSSIKFCMIAEGEADVYPRFGPTMEWDTAAGQAVLTAAGGCVMARNGAPLRYGKTSLGLRNDGFVAWAREPM